MHLLFIPDSEPDSERFELHDGRIKLLFGIKAKSADGKVIDFPPMIRYRDVDTEEAKQLNEKEAKIIAWMSWHLKEVN
jgi:uncharacterized protein YkvS